MLASKFGDEAVVQHLLKVRPYMRNVKARTVPVFRIAQRKLITRGCSLAQMCTLQTFITCGHPSCTLLRTGMEAW
jgi:hypothetical protein